jgi:hypothetical protein
MKKLAEFFQPSCQKPAHHGRERGKGKGKVITKQGHSHSSYENIEAPSRVGIFFSHHKGYP